jgi:patatin-like phospholipase/acyl hydrolase
VTKLDSSAKHYQTHSLAMPEHELRLLALDGGGVRGLSTLQILKQLMDVIDPESPPKPCDYFDMIGGTSTGGFVSDVVGYCRS